MSEGGKKLNKEMATAPKLPYPEPVKGKSLVEKMKAEPFVPIGVAGMAGMVGYGVYNFRNRGAMKASVYLMHLRVKAQGMVVGAITIGVAYSILRDHVFKKKSTDEPKK